MIDIFGVPGTKQKCTIRRKTKTAPEHKDGVGKGSDRTRGIVTGIREIPKGPERPKKSQGCNELKRELNKVQLSLGLGAEWRRIEWMRGQKD